MRKEGRKGFVSASLSIFSHYNFPPLLSTPKAGAGNSIPIKHRPWTYVNNTTLPLFRHVSQHLPPPPCVFQALSPSSLSSSFPWLKAMNARISFVVGLIRFLALVFTFFFLCPIPFLLCTTTPSNNFALLGFVNVLGMSSLAFGFLSSLPLPSLFYLSFFFSPVIYKHLMRPKHLHPVSSNPSTPHSNPFHPMEPFQGVSCSIGIRTG